MDIKKAFIGIIVMTLVGLLSTIFFIVYLGYQAYDSTFNDEVIESNVKVEPVYFIRDKDTVFIYTFKN